jgi:hypothetical protein
VQGRVPRTPALVLHKKEKKKIVPRHNLFLMIHCVVVVNFARLFHQERLIPTGQPGEQAASDPQLEVPY